jgi:hypothetical protein
LCTRMATTRPTSVWLGQMVPWACARFVDVISVPWASARFVGVISVPWACARFVGVISAPWACARFVDVISRLSAGGAGHMALFTSCTVASFPLRAVWQLRHRFEGLGLLFQTSSHFHQPRRPGQAPFRRTC